jgi:hypothetical protein
MLNDKLGVSDTISIQIVRETPKQTGERMSYSRWSNSTWYAFYNVNGCLSLWYDMDHIIDWKYEDVKDITVQKLIDVYDCSEVEAIEAIIYINEYLQDYDPKDTESYNAKVKEFLEKIKDIEDGQESV